MVEDESSEHYREARMVKQEQLALAVANGVDWLDQVHPNWVDEIDLNRLEMADGYSCVLGQLGAAASRAMNFSEDDQLNFWILVDDRVLDPPSSAHQACMVKLFELAEPMGLELAAERGFYSNDDRLLGWDEHECPISAYTLLDDEWTRVIRMRKRKREGGG